MRVFYFLFFYYFLFTFIRNEQSVFIYITQNHFAFNMLRLRWYYCCSRWAVRVHRAPCLKLNGNVCDVPVPCAVKTKRSAANKPTKNVRRCARNSGEMNLFRGWCCCCFCFLFYFFLHFFCLSTIDVVVSPLRFILFIFFFFYSLLLSSLLFSLTLYSNGTR